MWQLQIQHSPTFASGLSLSDASVALLTRRREPGQRSQAIIDGIEMDFRPKHQIEDQIPKVALPSGKHDILEP